jgi:hypothetical protein
VRNSVRDEAVVGRLRRVAIAAVAPKMRPVVGAFSLVVLVGCAPIYGANFDFPDQPAIPGTANVLSVDKGSDDDDPMRARVKVIDIGNSPTGALLNFYRATYGSADGWTQLTVDGRHEELCLVRHASKHYSEFVEVFPFRGSRVTAKRGRHLVLSSRLQSLAPGADDNSCGLATAWIPSDLLAFHDVSPPTE